MTKEQLVEKLEDKWDVLNYNSTEFDLGTIAWHKNDARMDEIQEILKLIKELN